MTTHHHEQVSVFLPGSAAAQEAHNDNDTASAQQDVHGGRVGGAGQQGDIAVLHDQRPDPHR